MRNINVNLTALLICALFPALAPAQDADKGKRKKRGNREALRKRFLERFDKDGDGKLNEQERAAARKAREQFRKRRGNAGKNGRRRPNGRGSDRRRPNGGGDRTNGRQHIQLRMAIMRLFDQNRNGRLDPAERERLIAFVSRGRGGKDRPNTGRRRRPGGDRAKGGEARRKAALKRFDTNGNGRLDPDERKKAREFFQKRRGQGRRRPDGVGGAVKRADTLDKDVLKKYDTNGDGKIDANERRQALRDRKKNK